MTSWSRRSLLAFASSLAPLIALKGVVEAQDFPARPVRIVVPFAAGGSTDAVVRILAQQLSEQLGNSFFVDNRPGGAATIGMNVVAHAAADGYTLGAANISFGVNPSLIGKVPYDTEKDFVPVGFVALVPLVLAVHPSIPVRSVEELVALAKAKPETLSYSSAGYGSGSHLSMELFCYLTGTKLTHVPYNGGGPQVAATLSGQIPILFATIPSSLQHFKSGALIPLAITTAKRDPSLPDVSTVAEAGVPGYEMGDWIGIVAPKGAPAATVTRLNQEIDKALAVPDVRAKIEKIGTQVVGGPPAALENHIRQELDKWHKVVTTMGLRVN
jgi:tripartite-type tricarboxylate transporter receptor subunit TctC